MYIRDLEYYQQLIIQKNFSKVAAYFNVSQPTISAAIKRLEEELSTQLVIRDHSHNDLYITLAGEQLNKHANQILNEWLVTKDEISRLNNNQITLGLPPIIRNYYFTDIATLLNKQGLLANIQTIESGSNELRKALIHGKIDIALLGSDEPLAYKSLITEEFDRHKFQIFVNKHHPLANRGAISFAEVKGLPFILLNESFIHTQAINKLANRNHMRINTIFHSSDIGLITDMVAANLGITFLASITKQPHEDVVALDLLDVDQPEFITSIAYRTAHVLTPAQLTILDLLHNNLHK